MFIQIAIDGASGVGKSTLAKSLASSLNYTYINSGLIFRGIAWYLSQKPGLTVEEALEEIIKYKHFLFDKNCWYINDTKIQENDLINQTISNKASDIAKNLKVRKYVCQIEKNEALKDNVIMDGRDIGTKIFPEAKLKIFLVGSLEVRAERRYKELKEKGILGDLSIDDVTNHLVLRDKQDMEREHSPLSKADDAIVINVDNYTVQQLTDKAIELLNSADR